MMYVLLLLLSENKTTKIASNSFGPGYSAASNTLLAKQKPGEFHGCVIITSSVRIGVKAVLSIYNVYNVCSSYRILKEIVLVIMCPED
jgi:hypothetical protein